MISEKVWALESFTMGSKHIFSLHLRYSDFIILSSKPTCHLPQRETLSLSSEASLKTKITTLPFKVVYHVIPLQSWWITMDRQSQRLIHQRGINVRNMWSDLSSTQRTSIKTSRSYGGLCDVFFLSETFGPFVFFFLSLLLPFLLACPSHLTKNILSFL